MTRSLVPLLVGALAACVPSAPQSVRNPATTTDVVANADGSPLIPCAAKAQVPASFAELRVGARCEGCSSDSKRASGWGGPQLWATAISNASPDGWRPALASASVNLVCDAIDGGYRIGVEGKLLSQSSARPARRTGDGAAGRWAEPSVVARARTPFTVKGPGTYCLIVRRFDKAEVRSERAVGSEFSTTGKTEPTLVTLQNPAGLELPMSAGSRILLEDPGEWTVLVDLESRYRSNGSMDVAREMSNTLDVVFAARQADGQC